MALYPVGALSSPRNTPQPWGDGILRYRIQRPQSIGFLTFPVDKIFPHILLSPDVSGVKLPEKLQVKLIHTSDIHLGDEIGHPSSDEALKAVIDAENAELAGLSGGPANLEAVTAFRETRPPDFSTL